MAFIPDSLSVIVQPIGGTGIRFFSYRTDDSVGTVTGASYFVGAAKSGVRDNDLVFVTPIDGVVEPYILVIDVDASGNGTGTLSPSDTALQPSDIGVTIASAAQGALADTALQPGEAATPAQGAKADTALQPATIGVSVQAYDLDLTAIAALSTSADQVPYATGAGTWALSSLTAFGRSLIDDADNTAARTTLGLGTSATVNTGTSGATIPLLNGTNTWSGVQTVALANAVPLAVSRTGSANNASISCTTTGGSVFFGTADGTDWAVGLTNNLFGGTTFLKINATTGTFTTDIALASNKAVSFAGTGAATTRTNLGLGTAAVLNALTGTATYDPPSLADGAGASTTVTVTGAALGDVALASFSLSTQGITVTANVTAADTVTVRFQNESGGVIDLASGTLKAVVFK